MTTVFVGDVGTEIALDCGVDVSSATVRNIIVRKSNRVRVVWAAAPDGANGIKYVTQLSDLDMAGEWSIQAYIEMPGWKGFGSIVKLSVAAPV